MKKIFEQSIVGILALAFVFACRGKGPAEAPAPAVSKPNAAVAAAKPVVAEERDEKPTYSYNPVGKRDPFEVFALVETSVKDVPLTPLQRYSIDQLRLIGIIWGISNPRAMVQDPKGKGHVIKRGTLIGRNWGKVSRIKQDEVIVAEEYRDIDGRLVVNEISLKLPKSKSEELEEEE